MGLKKRTLKNSPLHRICSDSQGKKEQQTKNELARGVGIKEGIGNRFKNPLPKKETRQERSNRLKFPKKEHEFMAPKKRGIKKSSELVAAGGAFLRRSASQTRD